MLRKIFGKCFNSDWALRLILFLYAALLFSALFDGAYLTIFEARDILRAKALLQGEWIWHGPELSGGGVLPGPFYYWLIAIPLMLFGTWQSIIGFMLFLCACAATLLWEFGRKYYSNFCALLMYFAFILSSVVSYNISNYWNPSFTFIFQVGILFLLFDHPTKANYRLFLAGVLIGLSTHIHFSQIILGLSAILVIWSKPPVNFKKKLKSSLVIFSGFFVTILPFVVWSLFARELRGSGYYGGGIASLLKPTGSSFEGILLSLARGSFFSVVRNDVLFLPFVGAWIVFFYFMYSKKKRSIHFSDYLVATLIVATPLSLWHVFRGFVFRYYSILFLTFYVLSSQVAEKVLERYPRVSIAMLVSAAVVNMLWLQTPGQITWEIYLFAALSLVLCLLTASRLSNTQRISIGILCCLAISTHWSFPASSLVSSLTDRERAIRQVIARTGWDYDFFRERAYVVVSRPVTDFSAIYQLNYEDKHPEKNELFDGVIIINGVTVPFLKRRESSPKPDWTALKSFLPLEIYNLASDGKITCALTETIGRNQICYYRFKDRDAVLTLNNLGYPYRYQTEPPLFEVDNGGGLKVIDRQNAVLYKNICSNHESACTIFFQISIAPEKFVKLRVTGFPVNSQDPPVNPVWAASIEGLRISVTCGSKTTESLTSPIGYWFPPVISGHHLLAPYEHKVQLGCANPSKILVRAVSGRNNFNGSFDYKMEPFNLEWNRM